MEKLLQKIADVNNLALTLGLNIGPRCEEMAREVLRQTHDAQRAAAWKLLEKYMPRRVQ